MSKFMRCNTQFIAALGDPKACRGSGAGTWGIWSIDPGPRGVHIQDWSLLKMMGGLAPSGWKFDAQDWWLEEHGLIMEKPDFPLPSGKYMVTGGRETQAVLTIHQDGDTWELGEGASLHDVTHLPCRSGNQSHFIVTVASGSILIRAANNPSVFAITEKVPTWAFSWLIVPTGAFT